MLYQFQGGADGANPVGIYVDTSGNVYGATSDGGVYNQYYGYLGTVFELSPPVQPGAAWTKATLFSFPAPSAGYEPYAPVVLGPDGNLYGTTLYDSHGHDGVVFELTPPTIAGQPWTETILHSFDGTDGGDIDAPVVFDNSGNLYGSTGFGGRGGGGTVFKLKPPSTTGGPWTSGWRVPFNSADGSSPTGSLVILPDDTIYGVTIQGGSNNFGTVYQIQP